MAWLGKGRGADLERSVAVRGLKPAELSTGQPRRVECALAKLRSPSVANQTRAISPKRRTDGPGWDHGELVVTCNNSKNDLQTASACSRNKASQRPLPTEGVFLSTQGHMTSLPAFPSSTYPPQRTERSREEAALHGSSCLQRKTSPTQTISAYSLVRNEKKKGSARKETSLGRSAEQGVTALSPFLFL